MQPPTARGAIAFVAALWACFTVAERPLQALGRSDEGRAAVVGVGWNSNLDVNGMCLNRALFAERSL